MPYVPQRITNHVEIGKSRLLSQYKGKIRIEGLLGSLLKQVQKLEDAAWEVITYRTIADGFGITLDKIGKLLGRPRAGLGDDDYKIALRAQIRINRSSGRPEDVIAVALLSVPEGFSIHYEESYPAGIHVRLLPALTFNITVLFKNLILAKDGGVRLLLIYTVVNPLGTLQFSHNAASVTTTKGFSDIDRGSGQLGGRWASVLDSGNFTP